MSETLSPVLEGLVALLVVLGAAVTLVGSIGLLRLSTFFERVHPPTMGTTLGVFLVATASIVLWSSIEGRPALYPILVAVFAIVTTPVTFMLLVRAAVHRERSHADERAAAPRDADLPED